MRTQVYAGASSPTVTEVDIAPGDNASQVVRTALSQLHVAATGRSSQSAPPLDREFCLVHLNRDGRVRLFGDWDPVAQCLGDALHDLDGFQSRLYLRRRLRSRPTSSVDLLGESREIVGVEDMCNLVPLCPETVLENLRVRFEQGEIYTNIGSILVAVNPQWFYPIYTAAEKSLYTRWQERKSGGDALGPDPPPHVFATAERAHQQLLTEGTDQCILISGETGSGKTQTAKFLLDHFNALTSGLSGDILETAIMGAGPVMEAFGNAGTVNNHNSSRFGKLTELLFSRDGNLVGAEFKQYLLERSRVVAQLPSENNYHIFYLLLNGCPTAMRDHLSLRVDQAYRYLASGNRKVVLGPTEPDFRRDFVQLEHALDLAGCDASLQLSIFEVAAAVLHIGNIRFRDAAGDVTAGVANAATAAAAAALLGLGGPALEDLLTVRHTVVAGETISAPLTQRDAEWTRDALALSLYCKLFSFLCERLNVPIRPSDTDLEQAPLRLSILDLTGFENLSHNSLEQLCCNLASERLQQLFNHHVFTANQAEYSREGIPWQAVDFFDNLCIVQLITDSKQGLMAMLEQAGRRAQPTAETLLQAIASQHRGNEYIHVLPHATAFAIQHYAGRVVYDADGLIQKNVVSLGGDVNALLSGSQSSLVVELARPRHNQHGTTGGPLKRRRSRETLSAAFLGSLDRLLKTLESARPHFVRCFKSNDSLAACVFDDAVVTRQLHGAGVLETVRIHRAGYSYKMSFLSLCSRFPVLFPLKEDSPAPSRDAIVSILSALEVEASDYEVGKTKVFLRARPFAELEAAEEKTLRIAAEQIQEWFRGVLVRLRYLRMRRAAVILQRYVRTKASRIQYLGLQRAIKFVAADPQGVAVRQQDFEEPLWTEAAVKRLPAARPATGAPSPPLGRRWSRPSAHVSAKKASTASLGYVEGDELDVKAFLDSQLDYEYSESESASTLSAFSSYMDGSRSRASSVSSLFDSFRSDDVSQFVSAPPTDLAVPPMDVSNQRSPRKKKKRSVKPVPCRIVEQDPHLGTSDKYGAISVLTDSGNDRSDCIWALHTGACHQGFVLDFTRDVKVGTLRIKNTGNNEFGFERGTRDFTLETSLDNVHWRFAASGQLDSVRGTTAAERRQLSSGERAIPWHTERFRPRTARFVRFTVQTFYGKGAALNAIQILRASKKLATRPSQVRLDTLPELERFEHFLWEFASALEAMPLQRDCAVFFRAVKAFHSHVVVATHMMLQGCSLAMTSGKSGRSFIELFRVLLGEELEREGLAPDRELGAEVVFEGSSLFRDLLVRFSRNRPYPADDEDEAYDLIEAEDSKRAVAPADDELHLGHIFQGAEFDVPVYCCVCQGLLWMLEPGYNCLLCDTSCHACCQQHVASPCSCMRPANGKLIIEPTGSFGLPLSVLCPAPAGRVLPAVVERCIAVIEARHLAISGLYRKAPPAAEYRALKQAVSDGCLDALHHADGYAVTAILKTFLASLPEPIVPYALYWELVEAVGGWLVDDDGDGDGNGQAGGARARALTRVLATLQRLPAANHACLRAVVHHLSLASRAQGIELSSRALGLLFGPSLMTSPSTVHQLLAVHGAFPQARVLQLLIGTHLHSLALCAQDVATLTLCIDQASGRQPAVATRPPLPPLIAGAANDAGKPQPSAAAAVAALHEHRAALLRSAGALAPYVPSELALALRRTAYGEPHEPLRIEQLLSTRSTSLLGQNQDQKHDDPREGAAAAPQPDVAWRQQLATCLEELEALCSACPPGPDVAQGAGALHGREQHHLQQQRGSPGPTASVRDGNDLEAAPPDGQALSLGQLLLSFRRKTSDVPTRLVRRDSIYAPTQRAPPNFASIQSARAPSAISVTDSGVHSGASRTPSPDRPPRRRASFHKALSEGAVQPAQLIRQPSIYVGPSPPPMVFGARSSSSLSPPARSPVSSPGSSPGTSPPPRGGMPRRAGSRPTFERLPSSPLVTSPQPRSPLANSTSASAFSFDAADMPARPRSRSSPAIQLAPPAASLGGPWMGRPPPRGTSVVASPGAVLRQASSPLLAAYPRRSPSPVQHRSSSGGFGGLPIAPSSHHARAAAPRDHPAARVQLAFSPPARGPPPRAMRSPAAGPADDFAEHAFEADLEQDEMMV